MIVPLACPHCRTELAQVGQAWRCSSCARQYPYREGILSFLEPEQSFNPTGFQETQEHDWSDSAQLRDHIRNSKLLSLLNWLRIKFSMSGRRDRIFYKEMHGGSPTRIILDIGCGGGRHYFTHYGRVVGIDPVLDLLQIAKGIYAEVYHASAFNLPFPDNTFDYVVSSDVIGHIPSELKDTLFAEMYRVLKHGGRAAHVIETDSTNYWFSFAHRYPDLFQRYFVERPGHISLEMPSQLRERFVRHGFRQVRFCKYASNVQECGWLSGSFNNEFRRKSTGISLLVALDGLLAGNLATKELTNLLLEPVAQLVDRFTPFDHAGGALVVFEKPSQT